MRPAMVSISAEGMWSLMLPLVVYLGKHRSMAAPQANMAAHAQDKHGGVKMGVATNHCDNGMDNLTVDWDNSTNYEYTCQPDEAPISLGYGSPLTECIPKDEIPWPLHKCMSEQIIYTDPPPRAGPHRPLWPVFGEYVYIPPERWVHALEHGAAVFLYHPCADESHIKLLRSVATDCLRRHVITPYRNLPPETPFAIVTYGCRFMMSHVDVKAAKQYVKAHAIKDGPEWRVTKDGQYPHGLIKKAEIVPGSDLADSNLCPPLQAKMGPGVNGKPMNSVLGKSDGRSGMMTGKASAMQGDAASEPEDAQDIDKYIM